MIKVRAKILLYKSVAGGRQTAFLTGYRPLFNFIPEMKTSGQITLSDRPAFFPGEEGFVEITFLSKDYLGKNFGAKTKFTFSEGRGIIGKGEIVEVISAE